MKRWLSLAGIALVCLAAEGALVVGIAFGFGTLLHSSTIRTSHRASLW